MLNREQFLKPRQLKSKPVEIEGFGTVRIKQLSKSQLCEFQKWMRPKGVLNSERYGLRDLRLICMSVVDENDKPILSIDDMKAVANLPGDAMDTLTYEVMVLNGYMVEVDEDELLGKSDS